MAFVDIEPKKETPCSAKLLILPDRSWACLALRCDSVALGCPAQQALDFGLHEFAPRAVHGKFCAKSRLPM